MMSCAIALALVVWGALALALAHLAERSASHDTAPISAGTMLVMLALAGLAVTFRAGWQAAACGASCIALVAAARADARTGYLFDAVTLPSAALAATLAIAAGTTNRALTGVALLTAPFGSLVVLSRGRWMGLGDVKAMYALGAAFGPAESLIALFAACLSGIVTATFHGRLQRGREVRFGPHLAAGAAFTLVAGEPIARGLLGS
jgi:prepilin signal peptidase PulO-like enzyme (type II secretory pathway)